MLVANESVVLPTVGSLPTVGAMLQKVAPEDLHESVAFSGGTIGVGGVTLKARMCTGPELIGKQYVAHEVRS